MISHDDKFSIMHHGRTSFTKAGSHVGFSQVTLPELLAIQVVTVKTGGTKPAIQALAVSHRRSGSEITVTVMALMRYVLLGRLSPDFLAR